MKLADDLHWCKEDARHYLPNWPFWINKQIGGWWFSWEVLYRQMNLTISSIDKPILTWQTRAKTTKCEWIVIGRRWLKRQWCRDEETVKLINWWWWWPRRVIHAPKTERKRQGPPTISHKIDFFFIKLTSDMQASLLSVPSNAFGYRWRTPLFQWDFSVSSTLTKEDF